jgi:hypothetical protein
MSQLPVNMQNVSPQSDLLGQERAEKQPGSLLQWWYSISGSPGVPESASFYEREQVRQSRIASLIILGMLLAVGVLVPAILLAAPSFFVLPQVIFTSVAGLLCCLLALLLNRMRQVQIAGVLLILAVDIIVAGVVLGEKNGLDPILLSMFDLLVITELIAASLLPPGSVFAVALLNMALLVIDVNLQPRSMMWMQMIQSQQLVYSLLARPAVLYLVVAAVAYLWVRSALNALKRADRAELIAELERRELEQKAELERAIGQILQVHRRVANGDLNARVPLYEHHILWQVSNALNNLLARHRAASQDERNLKRVAIEIANLRTALQVWRAGQPLRWYPTEKNLLVPLAEDLKMAMLPERSSGDTSPIAPVQNQINLQRNVPGARSQAQEKPAQEFNGQKRPWPQLPVTPLPAVNERLFAAQSEGLSNHKSRLE